MTYRIDDSGNCLTCGHCGEDRKIHINALHDEALALRNVATAAARLLGVIGDLERCSMSTDKACDDLDTALRAYDAGKEGG